MSTNKIKYRFLMAMMPGQIKEVAAVMQHGAEKYEPNGYMQVEKGKYIDALYRHLEAYFSGEKRDPESGLHHLAHAAANCLILMKKELGN